MNKRLFLEIIFLILLASPVHAYKFGLGSCLDQDLEQGVWSAIEQYNIDGFIFLGDNVYGDTRKGNLLKMKNAYAKQKENLPSWLKNKNILSIWDDHDYGLNDGGAEYSNKEAAKNLFLDFWDIPPNDQRRNREGLYFQYSKIIEGKKIKFIGLDTRYFRSSLQIEKGKWSLTNLSGKRYSYKPNNDSTSTILGRDQWQWFNSALDDDKADIIVILSSIQILATNHPYEKWGNFPLERKKLLEKIASVSKEKTIIGLSGDRHRSGIYQYGNFIELTASSLNKISSKDPEYDPLLIGDTYPEVNFGILDIQPSKNKITLSIHNKNGKELKSITIPL